MTTVQFQPEATRRFNNLADLSMLPSNTYCQPSRPNEPAVDSLLLPATAFQMTVAKPHAAVVGADMDAALEVRP